MTDSENRKAENAMAQAKNDQMGEMRGVASQQGGMPTQRPGAFNPGQQYPNQLTGGPTPQISGVGGVQNPQNGSAGGVAGGLDGAYTANLEKRIMQLEMQLGDFHAMFSAHNGVPSMRPEYGMGGDPNVQRAAGFKSFHRPYGPGRETSGREANAQRQRMAQEGMDRQSKGQGGFGAKAKTKAQVAAEARKKDRKNLSKLGR